MLDGMPWCLTSSAWPHYRCTALQPRTKCLTMLRRSRMRASPMVGGGCAVVPTGAQQLGQAQHGPRSVARSAGDHHVDTSAGAARRGTGPAPAASARAPGAQPHHLDDRAPRRHRRGAGPRPARRTGLASPTIKAGSASTATSRTSTMRSRTGAWAPLSGQLVG